MRVFAANKGTESQTPKSQKSRLLYGELICRKIMAAPF